MSWFWQPLLPASAAPDPAPPPPPAGGGVVDRGIIAGLMRGVMFGVGGYVFTAESDAMKFIATVNASASSTIDFVNGSGGVVLDGTYDNYVILISEVVFSTNAVFNMRTSSNAGVSYDSGASDYAWLRVSGQGTSATASSAGDIADTFIDMGGANYQTGAGKTASGEIVIYNPSAALNTMISYSMRGNESGGGVSQDIGSAARLAAADVDAIRIYPSAGNFTSGTFSLYGIKLS
jgi:hypothetical protein